MLRHLTLLVAFLLCGSIIQALPVDVESAQPTNAIEIQKSADSHDDLDTAASSWGGYGIRGWLGPSYFGGSYGERGHYGGGWGGNRGHHYGGNGWGNQGYGGGWGNGWGNNGWGRNYGSGWNRGGYSW